MAIQKLVIVHDGWRWALFAHQVDTLFPPARKPLADAAKGRIIEDPMNELSPLGPMVPKSSCLLNVVQQDATVPSQFTAADI